MESTCRKATINTIRHMPELAEAAVAGLNDEQLDTPYGEGKWTLRQVIHHLADSHLNGFSRTKLIVSEDNPPLQAYDQTVWARMVDGYRFPIASSILILRGVHERWTAVLKSLSDDQWARPGTHSVRGALTLEELLKVYVTNGEAHIQSITDFRAQRGW